jgi:hypothetical protein
MKEITAALMSCGEWAEAECLASIEPFRDEVEFIEIRNVFPQVEALNQMIECVKTEYFFPLDADMILKPNAWERILDALNAHRFGRWHSILFPLWDTLTERKILALKLMRSKVMKENPFIDGPTPDVEHFQRLTSLGFTCVQDYLLEEPIGLHVVKGKQFCYSKFRDVYQTYKTYDFEWDSGVFMGGNDLRSRAKAHFDYFLLKYLETGKKDYLHCIAGMMDGILSPLENKSKSYESIKYSVNSKYVIETFMNWHTGSTNRQSSAKWIF